MKDTNHTVATTGGNGLSVGGMADHAISVADCLRQAQLIQQVMHETMKDGAHFGVIPGTQGKKSLLKPGAEKLCFVFGLAPKLDIQVSDMGNMHREITVVCDLFDRAGNHRGQGVGSASTLESKHRYRGAAGKQCPSCGAAACKASKKEYGGGYYCDSKSGGCNARFKNGSNEAKSLDKLPSMRAENPDPADQYNTVLKMAKKRALVDAVLTATAASDIFDQDLEDLDGKVAAEDAKVAAAKPADVDAVHGEQQQQAARPATDTAQAKPAAHPAIEAARALYRSCERAQAGSGAPIIHDLCALYGAKAPQDVPASKLDGMAKLIADDLSSIADDPPAIMDKLGEYLAQAGGAA